MFTRATQTIRRHASRPVGRALVLSIMVLAIVVLVFRVVTPFLISSNMVKERMEQAVANWTGHAATIGGVSTIQFWPHPEVTLSDITIRRDGEEEGDVLATIAELSASFGLTEALLGQPVFEDFRLSRAHVFISRGTDGQLHWAKDGLLVDAIARARGNSGGQLLDAALDAPVGEVQIDNGIIDIVRETDGSTVRFEGINGTLDWPHLSGTAEIDAEASFRGRRLGLAIRSAQPLLLLDGRSGQFQGSVASDIGLARFDGVASLTARGYFSGSTELQASDMPSLLTWLGSDPAMLPGLASANVTARVIADEDELRLEDLSLGLNGERATGLLELDMPSGAQSRLSGTLAFDRMDFLALLTAMEPAISNHGGELPSLLSALELDLRLSGQSASLGAIQIQDIALGLMRVGQQFRMDILDGSLEPGRITGRINTIRSGNDEAVSLRMAVRDADFAAIGQRINLSGPFPAARGTLDLSLDVPRPITAQAWNSARGKIDFTAGTGQLGGISMAAIRQLAGSRPYFSLGEASSGTLEFDSIKATAIVHDGIADIQEAEIAGRNETIALKGAIPLINRSFAVSAIVTPKTTTERPLNFFIGGAWPSPVLWPTASPGLTPGQ